jgi:hypothetical protein
MGYRSLPFCQVAKSYLLGITESQYRGERGAEYRGDLVRPGW